MRRQPDPHVSVGFSGTRKGMTDTQRDRLRFRLENLKRIGMLWFHHGDCVGADREASEIARALGFKIARHPPEDPVLRAFTPYDYDFKPAPYLERNCGIVNSTLLLIAAPYGPEQSQPRSGTWQAVRYARETAKAVYLL